MALCLKWDVSNILGDFHIFVHRLLIRSIFQKYITRDSYLDPSPQFSSLRTFYFSLVGEPMQFSLVAPFGRLEVAVHERAISYIQYSWIEALSLPTTPSFETHEILGCQPWIGSARPNKYFLVLLCLALLIVDEFCVGLPKGIFTLKALTVT